MTMYETNTFGFSVKEDEVDDVLEMLPTVPEDQRHFTNMVTLECALQPWYCYFGLHTLFVSFCFWIFCVFLERFRATGPLIVSVSRRARRI